MPYLNVTQVIRLLRNIKKSVPLIGLDVGMKRIGLSICNSIFTNVKAAGMIQRNENGFKQLNSFLLSTNYPPLIIGWPLSKDGKISEQCEDVNLFTKELINYMKRDIDYTYIDERYSTQVSQNLMKDKGFKKKDLKFYKDSEAACVILKDFLLLLPPELGIYI